MKLITSNISDFKWRLHSGHFNPECTSKEVIEKISAFFNLLKDNYTSISSDKDTERLKVMERTSNGFEISEEDFRLRGSGDLFGIRQSGDMKFKIANIRRDYNLLLKVKDDVLEYMN